MLVRSGTLKIVLCCWDFFFFYVPNKNKLIGTVLYYRIYTSPAEFQQALSGSDVASKEKKSPVVH